ncbi:MAG TPA: matrixin family metalloprotease [Bryobacteraceae bacterium]|nr:matrixin family metalloprotease [Bryobacteraceae bacterium]
MVRNILLLLTVLMPVAMAAPPNWSGPYVPCNRHSDLLSHGHMDLGVKFSTSNAELVRQFEHAMDFWAGILDFEWHEVGSQDCSIQLVDGSPLLFAMGDGCGCVAARSQYPDRADFQGLIAFNPAVRFTGNELFLDSVHEIGHLFGLPHNPSSSSVMFFSDFDQDVCLDAADLEVLAARHKLRPGIFVDRALAVAAQ